MSLYSEYLKERENFDCIESDNGFITFQVSGKECYIRDLYIRPAFRNKKNASELANQVAEIAKQSGCSHLTGSVDVKDKELSRNIQVLMAYGFKLFSMRDDMIYLIKEIN